MEQFELVAELEGLGVVWTIKHFRPYFYGHNCDVFTDHETLKAIMNIPQPSGRLASWGLAIQELDLKIMHRAGCNTVTSAFAPLSVVIPWKLWQQSNPQLRTKWFCLTLRCMGS